MFDHDLIMLVSDFFVCKEISVSQLLQNGVSLIFNTDLARVQVALKVQ